MAFSPKVSIIIPVYNGSNYLKEAIDSALSQTYKNIEIIVVNDGSNDEGETEQIALSYKNKIRYYKKQNGGVSTALNLGIQKMTGEYFSWLSHDDLYDKNKVACEVEFLSTCTDRSPVIYSDFENIDANGNLINRVDVGKIRPSEFVFKMISSHPIQGCTALIDKKIFADVGRFNEKLKATQDYDMWFRIAQKYQFIHIKGFLVRSRIHKAQGTAHMNSTLIEEGNNLFESWLPKIVVKPSEYMKFAISLTKKCYLRAGKKYFAKYASLSKKTPLFWKNLMCFYALIFCFVVILKLQNFKKWISG